MAHLYILLKFVGRVSSRGSSPDITSYQLYVDIDLFTITIVFFSCRGRYRGLLDYRANHKPVMLGECFDTVSKL